MFALLKPIEQPRETFVPTLNKQESAGGEKAASASVHMHFKAEADLRALIGVRGERKGILQEKGHSHSTSG